MAITVWRGQMTFGLVSVPVRLYRAARKERLRLQYLGRSTPLPEEEDPIAISKDRRKEPISIEGPRRIQLPNDLEEEQAPVTRLKQQFISTDGQTIQRQDVLKGYEVAPNQYVTVQQDELRQLRVPTSPAMEILRTTKLSEIDPLYFETSYFVVPEPIGERAYALLYAALEQTNYAALAKVAMHGRKHVILVRPGKKGLLAHTLFYNDELRADTEFTSNVSGVSPKELALAKTFVEAIAGDFAPEEFKDTYREQLRSLITAKTDHQELASAAHTEPNTAPIIDIMDALKESLERAKNAALPRRQPGKATSEKGKRRKA